MKLPTDIEDKYLKEVLLNFSIEDFPDEEWKVIEGFESYAISNYGRILDVKSPRKDIIKSKNIEQAYYYAIHSEVRVNFYALCNGKEFTLFDVQKTDPVLHFPIEAIPLYCELLKKFLAPENIFVDSHNILAKDFRATPEETGI